MIGEDRVYNSVVRDLAGLTVTDALGVVICVMINIILNSNASNDKQIIQEIADYLPRQYDEVKLLAMQPLGTKQ